MSFLDRFKRDKKREEEELDILEELDEPFSLDQFLEEHVVERYKAFRKILEEQGILFFLLSPFQYKNRLLLKLAVVFFGVLLGVVPRSMSLIDDAKERNAASELAQIAGDRFNVGRMTIKPLESSQYNEQHMLTFLIEGETSSGVPSTIERFDVDLFPLRGVVDAKNVHYSYDILPVDNSQRILIMYVDNREQDDDTGIFGLTVQIKDDDVPGENILEIVLSDGQDTTPLLNEDGIDLAVLTDYFIVETSDNIAEIEDELEEALSGYELMVDRLVADGYDVGLDSTAIHNHVENFTVLEGLTDESTVRNLPEEAEKREDLDENEEMVSIDVQADLAIEGRYYRTDDDESDINKSEMDSLDQQAIMELSELQSQADLVISKLSKLNSVRQEKYDNLVDLQRILNRVIDPKEFKIQDVVEKDEEDEVDDGETEESVEDPVEEDTPEEDVPEEPVEESESEEESEDEE